MKKELVATGSYKKLTKYTSMKIYDPKIDSILDASHRHSS